MLVLLGSLTFSVASAPIVFDLGREEFNEPLVLDLGRCAPLEVFGTFESIDKFFIVCDFFSLLSESLFEEVDRETVEVWYSLSKTDTDPTVFFCVGAVTGVSSSFIEGIIWSLFFELNVCGIVTLEGSLFETVFFFKFAKIAPGLFCLLIDVKVGFAKVGCCKVGS